MQSQYVGRFAPSPTGHLHLGSLAAAIASFVDARAHNGRWLIRIEDVDQTRCKKEWAQSILETLKRLEMPSDAPIIFQSDRVDRYEEILEKLKRDDHVFGCSCSRSEINKANVNGSNPNHYPGTCRTGTDKPIRAWRFLTDSTPITFTDRWMGPFTQDVEKEVGDFVIKRADGLFAYQLAVIVDDHDQGINHIVRGADLIDNTARQIAIYRALGFPVPHYMHIPLVLNDRSEKLSKQAGATPLTDDLLAQCEWVWTFFGFSRIGADSLDAFYRVAIEQWQERFAIW